MEFWELWKIAGPLLAVGGAWGGAKVALNGTRDRVKLLEAQFNKHTADEIQHDIKLHERLTGVETKLDILLQRVEK